MGKMDNMNCIKKLQNRVQKYMRFLRMRARIKGMNDVFDNSEIIKSEIRDFYENGETKERIVVFLRGSGCSRIKNSGGCTFCGFYNATNKGIKIEDRDYINQMKTTINNWDKTISKICIYNDGSLLCNEEISFKTFLKILELIDKIDEITHITIEAKIEDITENKLKAIRSVTSKNLEIAVGFESANKIVRDICINKSFDNDVFERVINMSEKYAVDIIPLLMLKPPFLTEKEAAEDFINSLVYLDNYGVKRIDIELPTVELDTLTFELWSIGEYKPANLWTLVYILREKERLSLKVPLYISPMEYSVDSYDKSFSCNKCFNDFVNSISRYNELQDSKVFDGIHCECHQRWKKEFAVVPENNLVIRIINCLDKLELQNNGIELDRNR